MKSIFKIIIFPFLFVNFAYCETYLPVGSEPSYTGYEIPLNTEGEIISGKKGVYFVLGDKFFPLESSYPHDTYSTYKDCSSFYSRYSSLDSKVVVSFYLGSSSVIKKYKVDPTFTDYNCKGQSVKTPAIKVHTSYHSTSGYYSCPNGGTFDPDTKTCKICNEGDELNSSGMCYTDCTKYDFKNGVIKIGFSDGTCADCSTSKNYNDLYKCLCSFSGSSFSNSGAFVGDNKGSNYANCDNGTQIRTPDNVFDDKPTEPKNPDKPTEPANPDKPINPGSGSSGGDITDPKPVPGGSGSVTTDPGDKPDGSDPKPDDKPKDPDNNNPGGGSPSADDILGKPVDYSGTLKEYSDKLEEINNKFSEGIKTVSDSLQSFKENYLSLIDVLGGGVNSINKKTVVTSCPKTLDLKISNVPNINFDVCKLMVDVKPLTYAIFFLLFSYMFLSVIYRFILLFFI
ncbi:3-oxoacyl-[acyl-carrier-protein] synthase 3 [Campylobacter hyointestinalis]|uniref:hypothetical protein n=1 Tax=Campylobacter hyointestinalis TaxID=198 RepID=UPI0008E05DF6|nr:hypothetical protein [Campylobacter hyointestinalis]QKF55659.1 hypothetical protein CHHT_0812 [Campylobacter hyointestinalis subsp. hyointestinalis]TXK48507.1 hypothetical protein A0Z69_02225 [Campylobacter hyointestinalis]SFT33417.1 hypothetical protein SAMN05421691_0142 [Campylobacter hyointestinalis]SUW90414.1 3-oxoacyl-[acyl-carrier-protein] synthase 3 [Campylobacter hyointestinalis]